VSKPTFDGPGFGWQEVDSIPDEAIDEITYYDGQAWHYWIPNPPMMPPTAEYSVITVTSGKETRPRTQVLIDGLWQPIGRSNGSNMHVWNDSVLRRDVESGEATVHEILHDAGAKEEQS
jgi:hypothetical protein